MSNTPIEAESVANIEAANNEDIRVARRKRFSPSPQAEVKKIRNTVSFFVKTLTGKTTAITMDLDDGYWRPGSSDHDEVAHTESVKMDVEEDSDSEQTPNDASSPKDGESKSDKDSEDHSHIERARVEHLKDYMQQLEGIPPSQQRLIFGGKTLDDSKELDTLVANNGGLQGGTIHMILALRGGGV